MKYILQTSAFDEWHGSLQFCYCRFAILLNEEEEARMNIDISFLAMRQIHNFFYHFDILEKVFLLNSKRVQKLDYI